MLGRIITGNLFTLASVAASLPLVIVIVGGAPAVRAQSSTIVFTDVTPAAMQLTDTLTESVAWGDYDNDGDQDLYLTNLGANRLFRNNDDGTFTDVTVEAGVGSSLFSVGTVFGDLDNDGDLDLYVVNFDDGDDVLYRNDGPVGPGGVYVFSDATLSAGTRDERSSRGIALLDYNRDGLLDIYVNAIGSDILYENQGNLTFVNVAAALGVDTIGQGVGAVATDLDGNGWIDLYTGNRTFNPNALYLNDHATFTDVTAAAGITETGFGMGVHSFDYDNDLDFDLYWTTWPGADPGQANALYENDGSAGFTEVAAQTLTTDVPGWGISDNVGDVDNDGWWDFFVTNGSSDTTGPNVLFYNEGDGTFSNATATIGGGQFDGRGVAFADFDNDGDLDLCVTADIPDANLLLRNDTDNGNSFLVLELVGACSNRSAIGGRVDVVTPLGATTQEVSGGAGRGSFNSLPLEFGLGDATSIQHVDIRWPSGIVQRLTDRVPGEIVTIVEPCGSLTLMVGRGDLWWARPHASEVPTFDVVRGDLGMLHSSDGDFSVASEVCMVSEQDDFFLLDSDLPAAGEGLWYLIREVTASDPGTFDTPSGSQVASRDAGIEASAGACQ